MRNISIKKYAFIIYLLFVLHIPLRFHSREAISSIPSNAFSPHISEVDNELKKCFLQLSYPFFPCLGSSLLYEYLSMNNRCRKILYFFLVRLNDTPHIKVLLFIKKKQNTNGLSIMFKFAQCQGEPNTNLVSTCNGRQHYKS